MALTGSTRWVKKKHISCIDSIEEDFMKFFFAIQRGCTTSDIHIRTAKRAAKLVQAGVFMAISATAGVAVAADENPADWPVYHGNGKSSRVSALDSINKTNVKKLKVAWIHQPGEITGG